MEAAALAYRAALLEEGQNADETDEGEAIGLVRGVFASVVARGRKHMGEILAVAGVMAFLLIALAASTRASSEPDQAIPEPPPAATMSLPAIAPRPLTAAQDELKVPVPNSATPSRIITPPRSHAPEQRNPERVSERRPEPTRISIPTVSSAMTNRVDSLVRAAIAPARILSESFPVLPALTTKNTRPGFEDSEAATPQISHVRLIGALPVPRYPSQLLDMDREVLVRFGVDTAGYPQMATFSVENSPNDLLTAAIRRVIQDLRFEPARSPAPEFKPIADRVQIRYLFRRSNR
jgi:hypothetical protein